MKLSEALKLSDRALGVIKCSYACIYDTAGNKLFSAQGVDTIFEDQTPHTYVITGKDRQPQYRAPVVVTDREMRFRELNPKGGLEDVYFTEFAKELITEKYTLTLKEKRDDPNGSYAKIFRIFNSGKPYMVKEVAFEWFPSNLVITRDGEYADAELRVSFNKRLEASLQKMESAKRILIGAGLSNLI